MQPLESILKNIEVLEVVGGVSREVGNIVFDTRSLISKGDIFFAIPGTHGDGSQYIDAAISAGASAVVSESIPSDVQDGVTYIRVSSASKALSLAAQNFYSRPASSLKIAGVTGTNGKTTIATLMYKIFTAAGYKCALISTVECIIVDEVFEATHTTPDPVQIAKYMDLAVHKGAKYLFMEVSSHALTQDRVYGINFDVAIFTNLTLDHLDYHKTFENYLEAKKILFDSLNHYDTAIINADDESAEAMVKDTKAHTVRLGRNSENIDFRFEVASNTLSGLVLNVGTFQIRTPLAGIFNAYNIMSVFAASRSLGLSQETCIAAISTITPPRGRLEFIKSPSGIYGVVDYAHTPDALENVLATLRELAGEEGSIITVVGCGGDRDRTKRPIMGDIAYKNSSYVVFTSDNPRSERPGDIINEIVVNLPHGSPKYEIKEDRKTAIQRAVALAKSGDIVLVAGKGHEDYQIVKGEKYHFSDVEELAHAFGVSSRT